MSSDPRINRLHDLIDAANDGTLDGAGYSELDGMLRDDAAMQRAYLNYTRFDGALAWEFGLARSGSGSLSGSIVKAANPSILARIGAGPLLATAAALVLAAAVVVVYVLATVSDTQDAPAVALGVVTDSQDAVWASEPLDAGATVNPGELAIDRGVVRMTLHSGVELTILAPARMSLDSPMSARLVSGRVYASVPERAIGYRVNAPGVGVVDLGTRFGVDARNGSTEVHVFEGAVEVHAGGSAIEYTAGHAAAVVAGRVVDEPDPDIQRFTYRVAPEVRYAHLRFDDLSSSGIDVVGTGVDEDVEITAWPLDRTPKMVDGFVGGAIAFDGDGQFLKTGLDGVSGHAARTVAMWVRVPADAKPADAYAFVAWGVQQQTGGKWQVCWNRMEAQGAPGALRCEVSGGYVVGTTDLRDGRWHHVAVVYPGGEDRWSGAIRLFVDGKPEALSGSNATPIDTHGVDRGGSRVLVGGFLNGNTSLRAEVDELYIIESALTDGQVARLMETNELETALIEP